MIYENNGFFTEVSSSSPPGTLRGTAALIYDAGWGPTGEAVCYTRGQRSGGSAFSRDTPSNPINTLLLHAERVYCVRPGGGSTAVCDFGSARFCGASGNEISVVCRDGGDGAYEVLTYVGGVCTDIQRVASAAQLRDNDYVIYNRECGLYYTACLPMTGGADGDIDDAGYAALLSAFDDIDFDVFVCAAASGTRAAAAVAYINARRNAGKYCRCVINSAADADISDSAVTSVYCGVDADAASQAYTVYYTAGLSAASPPGHTLTGKSVCDCDENLLSPLSGEDAREYSAAGNFVYTANPRGGFTVYRDINSYHGESALLCKNGYISLRDDILRRIRELYYSTKYDEALTGDTDLRLLSRDITAMLRKYAVKYGVIDSDSVEVSASYTAESGVTIAVSAAPTPRFDEIVISATVNTRRGAMS